MNLITFWLLAIYLLGYGAFFVAMFPHNEKLLAGSQPLGAKTYWLSLAWTTGLSLIWPFFVVRHFYARS